MVLASRDRPGRTSTLQFAARSARSLSKRDKLNRENLLKHGRLCRNPSYFEGAGTTGLLPDPEPGLALPLDGL